MLICVSVVLLIIIYYLICSTHVGLRFCLSFCCSYNFFFFCHIKNFSLFFLSLLVSYLGQGFKAHRNILVAETFNLGC